MGLDIKSGRDARRGVFGWGTPEAEDFFERTKPQSAFEMQDNLFSSTFQQLLSCRKKQEQGVITESEFEKTIKNVCNQAFNGVDIVRHLTLIKEKGMKIGKPFESILASKDAQEAYKKFLDLDIDVKMNFFENYKKWYEQETKELLEKAKKWKQILLNRWKEFCTNFPEDLSVSIEELEKRIDTILLFPLIKSEHNPVLHGEANAERAILYMNSQGDERQLFHTWLHEVFHFVNGKALKKIKRIFERNVTDSEGKIVEQTQTVTREDYEVVRTGFMIQGSFQSGRYIEEAITESMATRIFEGTPGGEASYLNFDKDKVTAYKMEIEILHTFIQRIASQTGLLYSEVEVLFIKNYFRDWDADDKPYAELSHKIVESFNNEPGAYKKINKAVESVLTFIRFFQEIKVPYAQRVKDKYFPQLLESIQNGNFLSVENEMSLMMNIKEIVSRVESSIKDKNQYLIIRDQIFEKIVSMIEEGKIPTLDEIKIIAVEVIKK